MISAPTVFLGVILALVYASVFHVVKGKSLIELPIFGAASLIGFTIGQFAAQILAPGIPGGW